MEAAKLGNVFIVLRRLNVVPVQCEQRAIGERREQVILHLLRNDCFPFRRALVVHKDHIAETWRAHAHIPRQKLLNSRVGKVN
eukprot:1154040-Prymnesium_polylepis.1